MKLFDAIHKAGSGGTIWLTNNPLDTTTIPILADSDLFFSIPEVLDTNWEAQPKRKELQEIWVCSHILPEGHSQISSKNICPASIRFIEALVQP